MALYTSTQIYIKQNTENGIEFESRIKRDVSRIVGMIKQHCGR